MKVLLWLIGFMSIVWADGVCDTKFSTVENKLRNQYSQELIGYKKYNLDTVASSSVCSKEDVHHEVVMLIPYIKKLSGHEGTLSFLIAIIDKKNNRIKESFWDKDAMKASYISYLFEIDTERYKKISNNRPFAIMVEDVLDGPPTASILKLFIYKRDKLKPILSNLTIETYDEEMEDFTMERKATLEKLKGSPSYETLIFKDKYYYGVNPYAISSDVKSSKEFEWHVNLDDITCHYRDEKYTCNRKPVFNLDEVEANTKKGLRYRKIVLLAMLYEEPLAEKNINVYNNIASNLRKNKYFDEAKFLSKILRKKFPEKGGIESSRLKELNSKLKKDQFIVLNHAFNLETYTNSKFSFSIDYPSEIFE